MNKTPITEFRGKYWFLSNFSESIIMMNGHRCSTVEHAFQASKSTSMKEQKWIRSAPTPAKAKLRGKLVTLRCDWEIVKESIMLSLLRKKFQIPSLKSKLLETGDRRLIEGNTWNDRYWGQCPIGTGKNRLGFLLMKVRGEIKTQKGNI